MQKILNHILVEPGLVCVQNFAFFVALVVLSAFLTNMCRSHIKIMDYASERSSHTRAVPRSGGIAIVATFCIGVISYYFIRDHYFMGQNAFWGLFISALIIALVSFYDDVTNKAFIFKLFSQLIGVAFLIAFDLTLNEWGVPVIGKVTFGPFRYILTVLWIVGITNAFNFMDGLDGLAGGVAVIVSLFFAYITLVLGSGITFHISYIIAAGCLGFLFFNFPRASIFMGDVGSTFLGFCFGAMAILAAHYDAFHTPFLVMPVLFANFILETLFTFIWRLIHRHPVYKAHKLHPYQLLTQMGVSSTKVTLIYYMQNIVLGVLAIIYVLGSLSIKFTVLGIIAYAYSMYFTLVYKVARERGLLISEDMQLIVIK